MTERSVETGGFARSRAASLRPPVVVARDVHKWFGDQHVLKGMDLVVEQGEIVSIIGPSGSGKSTFLRCVNHLEARDAGTIEVAGELVGYETVHGNLYQRRESDLARARSRCGMVFQQFNLFGHLTAVQNIEYFPRRVAKLGRHVARERALNLLSRVGLSDKAHSYPHQLSGGQQQRVAIARALAMDPRVMLFDEPTSSLDRELVAEVLTVIRDLAAQGMTMIIVTHEIEFARQISDVVVFMADGVAVERGTPSEVLDHCQHPRTQAFLGRNSPEVPIQMD